MSFHVLMYHEIRTAAEWGTPKPSPITVAQAYTDALPPVLFSYLKDFQAQMEYLKSAGYHTLTLGEVKAFYEMGRELPENSVLLTFDDAFQSIARYAYPILKQLQLQAVCFVVSGWLTEKSQPFVAERSVVMSKDELAKLADVFETANHTQLLHQRHADGTTELQRVSQAELEKDLAACGKVVAVPDVFAYPFGIYTGKDEERLAAAGIHYAFTTIPGLNTRNTPTLELHRHPVPLGCTLAEFKNILAD